MSRATLLPIVYASFALIHSPVLRAGFGDELRPTAAAQQNPVPAPQVGPAVPPQQEPSNPPPAPEPPATEPENNARVTLERRQHFGIVGSGKDLLVYEYTDILRISDKVDESVVLLRDVGHGEFLLRKTWNYEDQTVTYRLSDVKDRVFVQRQYRTPFTSKTRLETLAEARRNPGLAEGPVIVTLETNSGRWDGMESDWDEHTALREHRHNVRQTFDQSLLEAIERMRGTFFTTPIGQLFYLQIGRFIIYEATKDIDPLATDLTVRDLEPDCDFDSAFGYRCSEKQLARIAAALKEKKLLTKY